MAQAASQSWQAFASWADPLLPEERDKPTGMVYEHGYHCDPWNYDSDYDYSDWRMVALSVFCDCLSFFMGDIWNHFKKTLGLDYNQWPDQFITTLTSHPERFDTCLENAVRSSWHPKDMVPKERLRQVNLMPMAIRTPEGLERLFWEELKFLVVESLPELKAIESAIREGRPLGDRDLEVMALWLNTGTLVPLEVCDSEGAIRGEMRVHGNWGLLRDFPVMDKHLCTLLLPVGYSLCEAWLKSQPWPRFIATCRNPSCRRTFYSGHKGAVACPKKPHQRGTSECKAAWDKYKRWLVKTGRNADTEWADPQLQQRYLGH
ncbi:MAG: hypothetical protein NT049_16800 [Planctomycetota bacterium]|nr:hypothetical protein [Planctomycetota bacterium]